MTRNDAELFILQFELAGAFRQEVPDIAIVLSDFGSMQTEIELSNSLGGIGAIKSGGQRSGLEQCGNMPLEILQTRFADSVKLRLEASDRQCRFAG